MLQLGVWAAEGFGEEVVGDEASRQSEPNHWGLGSPLTRDQFLRQWELEDFKENASLWLCKFLRGCPDINTLAILLEVLAEFPFPHKMKSGFLGDIYKVELFWALPNSSTSFPSDAFRLSMR